MKKAAYVAGIDGGGTKTSVVLADRSGKILAEETGGPSNFQIIGVEKAAEVILTLIGRCCSKAGCSPDEVKAGVAGLTGAGRTTDQQRMKQALEAKIPKAFPALEYIEVTSDARIALEGAFGGGMGIILIAGTGSIAFGKAYDASILRVGGWGRTLGDEGSGYSLGRDGLNIVTKDLDGRIRKSLLTKLVAEHHGLTDQEKIIAEVYTNGFDVASIAPLVIEAASKNDLECGRILNRAAYELTEHVRALTLKIEQAAGGMSRQKIPLAFIGSLLTNDSIFVKIVKHKIEFTIPQIKVVKPQSTPSFGGVLMALQLMNKS